MKSDKLRRTVGIFLSSVLFLWLLAGTGCTPSIPIPPPGTKVQSKSEVFKRAAGDLQQDCDRMGGCTCFMDGIRTKCSLAFACLDAGFCELVKSE